MSMQLAMTLGLILAILLTIAMLAFVLPKKKDGQLSPALQRIHDIFHFKIFFLEHILKFLYLFATCLSVCIGFFLLFAQTDYVSYGYFSHNSYSQSTALLGLSYMLAPILLRIVYEFVMLIILAAKNLSAINRKLDPVVKAAQGGDIYVQPQPRFCYCTQCGTRYDANQGNCSSCGKQ